MEDTDYQSFEDKRVTFCNTMHVIGTFVWGAGELVVVCSFEIDTFPTNCCNISDAISKEMFAQEQEKF